MDTKMILKLVLVVLVVALAVYGSVNLVRTQVQGLVMRGYAQATQDIVTSVLNVGYAQINVGNQTLILVQYRPTAQQQQGG